MQNTDPTRPGRLVAIVGLDGAGKTTQVAALGDWLRAAGVNAETIPNQTLTPVRKSLIEIAHEDGYADHLDMLGPSTMRLISACSKLAYLAWLGEHLRTTKTLVVVDRYTVCQYAAARAQGAGNEEFLRRLNRPLPAPDLVVLLDVDPHEALRRIDERGTDSESLEFLLAFREAYRALPESVNFVTVDGNRDRYAVQESLRQVVAAALPDLVPSGR